MIKLNRHRVFPAKFGSCPLGNLVNITFTVDIIATAIIIFAMMNYDHSALNRQTDEAPGPDAELEPFELKMFTPYLISRVASLMEMTVTPALRQAGLTTDMWRVLMVLHFNGVMTLVALSRNSGVTTSTLSRLVGRLIDRDLVSRRRSTGDTRTVQVRIRPRGEALFWTVWPTADRFEALVTSRFGHHNLERLKTSLRMIETVLLDELDGAADKREPGLALQKVESG